MRTIKYFELFFQDVNECDFGYNICDHPFYPNQACVNTEGAYKCEEGFQQNKNPQNIEIMALILHVVC